MTDQEDNMSALSEQEMTTLLGLISKASHDQLRQVFAVAKTTSDLRSRQSANAFRVGTKVKWNGKIGPATGVVVKVKQKYVEVRQDGATNMTWNIPAAMLQVVP